MGLKKQTTHLDNEMCEVCFENGAVSKCPDCGRYTCFLHAGNSDKIPKAMCNRCFNLSISGRRDPTLVARVKRGQYLQ